MLNIESRRDDSPFYSSHIDLVERQAVRISTGLFVYRFVVIVVADVVVCFHFVAQILDYLTRFCPFSSMEFAY